MKKSVMKSLAAFLVLALMVASLPVAVFAEEPEHCHDEICCPDSEAIVSSAAICNHTYMSSLSVRLVDCGEYHRVEETTYHKCVKCGYGYHVPTGSYYTAAHIYSKKTPCKTLPNEVLTIYKYECDCGHIIYDY